MNLGRNNELLRSSSALLRRITVTGTGLLHVAVITLLLMLCPVGVAETPNWSQFRGPNANGVAKEQVGIPTAFGQSKNLVWKVALPSGASSPCIWNNRIFITSYDKADKKLETLCIDRKDGNVQWRSSAATEQIEKTHSSSNPACGTPAADGERIYVYFGSLGLLCYDHEGNHLWTIEQPIPQTRNGSGTSPVIVGELVLLNREEKQESYLLAVNRKSGEVVWKHEYVFQPGVMFEGYATPVIWNGQAIMHTHGGVRAIDISNGKLVWQVNTASTGCATPVVGGNHLFVATWNNLGEPALRPEYPSFAILMEHDSDGNGKIGFDEFPSDVVLFDRPEARDEKGVALPMRFVLGMFDANRDQQLTKDEWNAGLLQFSEQITDHGLLDIKLGGTGDVTATHVKVLEKRAIPEVPSPLYHEGRVYIIKRGGIVSCYRAETGKRLYRKRLRATGSYYASPIAVGQRIYFTSAQGKVTVVQAADAFKLLGVNDLGERTLATPAVAHGRIYIRTNEHLYAFGA